MLSRMSSQLPHDHIPMEPTKGWLTLLASMLSLALIVALYVLSVVIAVCSYTMARSNAFVDAEDSDAESSNSAFSDTGNLERLDSVAPPRTYRQTMMQLKLEGAGGHWSWLDSFSTCVVCEDLMRDNDTVRRLSCGHIFHSDCIIPWYLRRHYTCPLCKSLYMPGDMERIESSDHDLV